MAKRTRTPFISAGLTASTDYTAIDTAEFQQTERIPDPSKENDAAVR
jgi:hypothetical protein